MQREPETAGWGNIRRARTNEPGTGCSALQSGRNDAREGIETFANVD
jgi:hypothetical protein